MFVIFERIVAKFFLSRVNWEFTSLISLKPRYYCYIIHAKLGKNMNLKTKAITLLLVLLVSSLLAPFLVNQANAKPIVKNMQINDDGSLTLNGSPLSDDNAYLSTVDHVTYTVEQNFTGTITVLAPGIVLDGCGYTITGTGDEYDGGIAVSAPDVTVTDLKLDSMYEGIYLSSAADCNIIGNTLTNIVDKCVYVDDSSNANITGNTLSECYYGIYLGTCNDGFYNNVTQNYIADSYEGLYTCSSDDIITQNIINGTRWGLDLEGCSGITLVGNTVISPDDSCIYLYDASDNTIYHNNFIASSATSEFYLDGAGPNVWDNGYPSGGNYWSCESHVDQYSGAAQDVPGSDGIADESLNLAPNTHVVIYANSPLPFTYTGDVDNYPLVQPYGWKVLNVTVVGSGTTLPSAGENLEYPDSTAQALATPVENGEFYNWILDGQNVTGSTLSIQMSQNHNLTAVFREVDFTLTVQAASHGSVYFTGDSSNPIDGTASANIMGSTSSIRAQPDDGYMFSNWVLDGQKYFNNPISVTFDGDHNLEAVFISCPTYILPITSSDWPMYMHDLSHTGKTSIAGPLTNQTLWRFQTQGPIECSPAVVNNVVYFGSEDGYLYAVNASTNQQIWAYNVDNSIDTSPAVADGIVVFGAGANVYALNATDGQLLWFYQTGSWGVSASPALSNGVVYVGVGGDMYALNATTTNPDERVLWDYSEDASIECCPAIADGRLYFTGANNLYVLNATTDNPNGEKLWTYNIAQTGDGCIAIENGIVYTATNGGYIEAFNATAEDPNGYLWQYNMWTYNPVKFAVADGIVYAGSGECVCAFNGTTTNPNGELLWMYTCSSDNDYSAPIVANGVVYIGLESHFVTAFNATTDNPDGEVLWSYQITDAVDQSEMYSPPALANGVLFAGSADGYLYAFAPNNNVIFKATGLPEGKNWTVTFAGFTKTTASDMVTFVTCTQGQFSYTITPPQGYTGSSLSETLDVSDSDIAIPIVFTSLSPTTYNVVFTQSGLAAGTNWSVTLDGTTQNSTTDTITFSDYADGTYNYTVTTPAGYSTTTNSGTVTVADGDASQPIIFTQNQYTLTVNTVGEGCNVTINPAQDTYTYGASVQLTPVAASGWVFSGWSGDLTGTDNPATITMDSDKTITATFEKTNTIIATKTSDNQTYLITLGGNITAQQMSNMTITPYEDNATTTIAFTVTGPSGTEGLGTITLPKAAIPYGTTPQVYIDGVLAEYQSYTQDDENYYITYSTHFSTHTVNIIFVSPQEGTQLTFTQWPPIPQWNITASQTSTIEPTPTPPVVTPTPTATPTPAPSITPALAGVPGYVVLIAAVIALIAVALGFVYRRRSNKWS